MSNSLRLRKRLESNEPLVLPGAFDALSARIIEDIGFDALYATGAGFANSALGVADLGLVSMTEMAGHLRNVCDAVNIPVIADADTGFGGPLNTIRTVREFERAGVSAIQLEDQTFPKRCGHFDGKSVIPQDEMVGKIRAVIHARQDPNLVVIARTDARAIEGLDRAIERGIAYREAGADVLFVEALLTLREIEQMSNAIDGWKLLNIVEGGKTPPISADQARDLGIDILLFANAALLASMLSVQLSMRALLDSGSTIGLADQLTPWTERQRLVRTAELENIATRFSPEISE